MEKKKLNVDEDTGEVKGFSLPGFFCGPNRFGHKKSSRIVQHYEHSFNKEHRVIVVKGRLENRQDDINSYERITGVKNIMALIEKTKDWSLANNAETITGDVYEFTGNPMEVEQKIIKAKSEAEKSLMEFNRKFGTSFTSDQLLNLVESGEFDKFVKNYVKEKGDVKDANSNS